MDGRKVIAVINQKGGSTKTTTSVNVAAALAARDRTVRLIDLDPQMGSSTHWLPPVNDVGDGLLRVFNDEATLDEVTSPTSVHGVYIAPSYQSMRAVELNRQPGSELVLRNALQESKAPFDYEVVDCPHSMDVLAVSGIAAADELLIPLQASELDVVGMAELLDLAQRVKRRLNPDLRIAAVVVGRTKGRSGFDAQLLQDFARDYPDAVVKPISDSVKMREATTAHKPINLYEPNGRASRDFAALAEALDTRGTAG